MENNRKSKEYEAIIGILKDGEVVVLVDTFTHGGPNADHGACGCTFHTLSQEQIDAMNDPDENDYALDWWKNAVENGDTQEGYKEWFENINDHSDYRSYYFGDDPSFREMMDRAYDKLTPDQKKQFDKVFGEKGKDFVDWDNGVCGRCVELDPRKYSLLLRPDLLEIARKAEEQGVVED